MHKASWFDALVAIARVPDLGLVIDMDGTISPIVLKPEDAFVTAQNKELLEKLRTKLELVAVLSGRSVEDVVKRVNLPDLVYIGSHGLEQWNKGRAELMEAVFPFLPKFEALIQDVMPRLVPDMQVEDKGITVSVHYRQTQNPTVIEDNFQPLMAALAEKYGLTLYRGRMVFEFRPPIAVDKGTTIRQLVSDYRLKAIIYLGDDTTDVFALQELRKLRATRQCETLGIGVESSEMPSALRENADFLVKGVPGVEEFLGQLVSLLSK